jgi:hypothetical protein
MENPDVFVVRPVDSIPTELFHINHKKPHCTIVGGLLLPLLGRNISESLLVTESEFLALKQKHISQKTVRKKDVNALWGYISSR